MLKKLLLTFILCSLAISAWAQIQPERFSISPMIGGHVFEGNQSLDTSLLIGLGLGYNFTKNWALEAVLTKASADAEDSSTSDSEVNTYRLDAIYHLLPDQQLVPYLAAGLGGITTDPDVGSKENHLLLNYGVGLKYFIQDGRFALRADIRHLLDLPNPDNNLQYMLGLTFPIGGRTPAPAPAPAPIPVKEVEVKAAPKPAPAPLDTDGDGVFDNRDQCASTPLGVKVNAQGCPLDTDADGVFDYLDACPATPAQVQVDARGCPVDADQDGVLDYQDSCLGTPQGVSVDTKGCPSSLTLHINFGNDSSVIGPEYDAEIAKAAECINNFPGNNVFIDGHTDSSGDSGYNQKLSEQRAAAVMQRLIEKFNIKASRMTSRGFGEDRPIASNETAAGKAQNRRVEVGCGAK